MISAYRGGFAILAPEPKKLAWAAPKVKEPEMRFIPYVPEPEPEVISSSIEPRQCYVDLDGVTHVICGGSGTTLTPSTG